MDCDGCNNKAEHTEVGWAYVELLNGHHDRSERRLWIIIVILLAVILALVAALVCVDRHWAKVTENINQEWIDLWSEYDTISYDQDGDGNNIIGDNNRSWYVPENTNKAEETP